MPLGVETLVRPVSTMQPASGYVAEVVTESSTGHPGEGLDTFELRFARALRQLLRRSHAIKGSDLASTVNAVMGPLDIAITIYVADYEQRALRPLPDKTGTPAEV